MSNAQQKLRVLVVDDSAYNRQTLTDILEAIPEVEVAGRAIDGKEALRLAFELEPDVITLDLEMPEMDGFAFLRFLMSRRPTPVIVVSGYAERDNVFRALELGAMDFIPKPARIVTPELKTIAEELAAKIALVRKLQVVRLQDRARSLAEQARSSRGRSAAAPKPAAPAAKPEAELVAVVGIASSTGGPPAVHQLLSALPGQLPIAIVVAQHMPPSFTRAFADRLDRVVAFRAMEAEDGQAVEAGVVYVSPGACNVEMELQTGGGPAVLRVTQPERRRGGPDPLTPSADHLFTSMSACFGERMCGVILTGMGYDGTRGAKAASRGGGRIVVEDPATAVMPGMPQSAIDAGVADEVLPLEDLPAAIMRFVQASKRDG